MGIDSTHSIAIVGGGLGGAATAVLLQQAGYSVTVFERAGKFEPVGAGIHMTPNVMRVLGHMGVDGALIRSGYLPESFTSRNLVSNSVRSTLPLGDQAKEKVWSPPTSPSTAEFSIGN